MASKTETHPATDCDPLTGLAGAQTLHDHLHRWRSAVRGDTAAPIHAMAIALGRFDTVNLAYGEAAGDSALAEVARRIRTFAADELADGDWVAARLDGGKFVVAAHQPISRDRWQWLGEALLDALAVPFGTRDGVGTVRLWPRVALSRVLPGERPGHVLDRLAATLEQAADRSGARLLWASRAPVPAGIRSADLEADLLAALDRSEIEVVFQPQFSFADDRLHGAEVLARWRHPRIGPIGAGTLFAIAERADHVAHLSRHIADVALAEAATWPEGLHLSLNVTAHDLARREFAVQFVDLVRDAGFDPRRLTLEITEQVLIDDLQQAAITLAELKGAGIGIALDDFGGGFCNFGYLKLLPLDALKLDRSMITGIDREPRDRAVLRAIVAMATALDLSVVAEGIETEGQRAVAEAEGCVLYQGFLRAEPLLRDEFRAFAQGA